MQKYANQHSISASRPGLDGSTDRLLPSKPRAELVVAYLLLARPVSYRWAAWGVSTRGTWARGGHLVGGQSHWKASGRSEKADAGENAFQNACSSQYPFLHVFSSQGK